MGRPFAKWKPGVWARELICKRSLPWYEVNVGQSSAVQGAMFARSSKPDLFSRSRSFQSICRWTEHMECKCQPFGLICRAGLCSSFTFWPQWSSTLSHVCNFLVNNTGKKTCTHLICYLSNVQLLFVGISLENVKMDTSVKRSVIPRRVRGFAAWYNNRVDI